MVGGISITGKSALSASNQPSQLTDRFPCSRHPKQWDKVSPGDTVEVCLDGIHIERGKVDPPSPRGGRRMDHCQLGRTQTFHKDDNFELIQIR